MRQSLAAIAKSRSLSFVVGLIDEERHNCAYFVDSQRDVLMSQKITDDGSGEYSVGQANEGDSNPVYVDGIGIAALICVDAFGGSNPDANTRMRTVVDALDSSTIAIKLLCVPASLGPSSMPNEHSPEWRRRWLALANSRPRGAGSLILRGATKQPFLEGRNIVCLSTPVAMLLRSLTTRGWAGR